MTLEEEVITLVANQLGVDQASVKPSQSIVEDLNADSLDLTALIMEIEEKFGIEVPEEKTAKLKTVQDVIDFIATAKASAK